VTADDRTLRPFDPGLQIERTALAWRRTGLALAVLAVGGARLLSSQWGAGTVVAASVGVVAAAITFVSRLRHRTQHVALNTAQGDLVVLPGGALAAALALCSLILGLIALAFAIARSAGA